MKTYWKIKIKPLAKVIIIKLPSASVNPENDL